MQGSQVVLVKFHDNVVAEVPKIYQKKYGLHYFYFVLYFTFLTIFLKKPLLNHIAKYV